MATLSANGFHPHFQAPNYGTATAPRQEHHLRSPTFPLYHTTRKKPRKWPLLLRFVKGAVHSDIAMPVCLHAAFAALIVFLDNRAEGHLQLPASTIPSLSIVVGLMLVFRNSTSYDRFWQGNQHLTTIETSIRNLTRSFLTCSYTIGKPVPTEAEQLDTERTIRILLALIYAAKHHLRAEWGSDIPLLMPRQEVERRRRESMHALKSEYSELLGQGQRSFEEQGLGLLLQLSIQVEGYIKRGHDRGWFHAPQASQMTLQLNTLVAAYGSMETIHLTPLYVFPQIAVLLTRLGHMLTLLLGRSRTLSTCAKCWRCSDACYRLRWWQTWVTGLFSWWRSSASRCMASRPLVRSWKIPSVTTGMLSSRRLVSQADMCADRLGSGMISKSMLSSRI